MAKAEINCKVNVAGLKALDNFLDKHDDKVQLVGSFNLMPGDILFDEENGVYYGASESRKDGQAAGY